MDSQRKIILYAWLAAAVLGLALIVLTRSKGGTEQNLSTGIVGTWQGVGTDETDQFRDDGTVLVSGQGNSGVLKYKVLDPHQLQFSPEHGDATPPHVFKQVSIKGDRLTMTDATSGGTVSYNRLQSSGVAAPQSPTELKSERPISRSTPPSQITDPQLQQQKTAELKTVIVGKWQIPGQKDRDEWSDDNTVVVINGGGEKLNCSYHVAGYNRVLIVPEGSNPMQSPVCIVDISGDVMTFTRPTRDGPETQRFVRLNAKGEMPKVSLPPPLNTGPAINSSDIVGRPWKSQEDQLVFSPDGTFTIAETKGQWKITGGEILARGNNVHDATWKLTLSSDGKTLAGYWSAFGNSPGGITGTIFLTR